MNAYLGAHLRGIDGNTRIPWFKLLGTGGLSAIYKSPRQSIPRYTNVYVNNCGRLWSLYKPLQNNCSIVKWRI